MMTMVKSTSEKKVEAARINSLLNMVFSWSLQDVLNKKLYKNKVKKIPDMFSTTAHYLSSFHYPLIEEIRAEFSAGVESVAQSPACEISNLRLSKNYKPPKSLYYEIMTQEIRDVENNGGQYVLQSGDLVALTNVRPQTMEDLIRPSDNMFLFAYVETSNEDEPWIQIVSSKEFEPKLRRKKHDRLFATFLMNMTTSLRIWRALNPNPKSTNMGLIQKVLQYDSTVNEDCSLCINEERLNVEGLNVFDVIGSLGLDESQKNAVISSIAMRNCSHQSNNVKLIWGPPGTGKTKTVASLLFVLLKLKCRTLTCAPTNIAVVQVANRLVKLFLESNGDFDTYGLGDIVLFGHEERMKIDDHDELVDVFLENRKRVLVECLDPFFGWKPTFVSMTSLLEDPQARYNAFLQDLQQRKNKDGEKGSKKSNDEAASEGQEGKNNKVENKKKNKRRGKRNDDKANDTEAKTEEFTTFEEYFKKTFDSLADRVVYCMKSIYSHLPTSSLPLDVAKNMIRLVHMLKTITNERKKVCRFPDHVNLLMKREEILSISSYISHRFPKLKFKGSLRDFCLSNAKLIFCTASSSMKVSKNVEMVIIDEAAQLKECESTIPLQVPGLRNAVLIGDDRQLPAMVQSKALGEMNFGRSLFQRLAKLGKKTLLLNIQYRMHPSISLFPNKEFYKGRIIDAPKVAERSYFRSFLKEDMYGSYSFINVSRGKEDIEKGHSPRNMEEAVVVDRIVAKLFKGLDFTKQKLSVGVISPYKGQVCLIQEKIGKKYANYKENFAVNVRSIDGFQGGEEDVIIISTVRCNRSGSVGFLSNHQRTNVALTRARYCLWIVGNCTTLAKSGSVWKNIVTDAKTRGCFYEADEDLDLAQAKPRALVKTSKSTSKLDFFGSLNLVRAKWKVFFGNSFKTSITSISSMKLQNQVQEILKKIADGWRQSNSEEAVKNVVIRSIAFELLELYKVDEQLYLAWTIDIIKEESEYTQAIKAWDILPASKIPKLAKELDILFKRYTSDFMNRRKYKAFEGNLVVPMSWPLHSVFSAENLSDQFSDMNIRHDQEELSSESQIRNKMRARSGLDTSLRWRKRTGKDA